MRRAAALLACGLLAAACGWPAGSSAATYPTGFAEQTVFSGLTNPTAVALRAGRARLRRREERPDQGLRRPRRHRRRPSFADLRTKVHNFWDRGLLGLALDPDFPTRPVRLRPLHARRGDRRHRAALGHRRRHLRRVPDPAGRDRRRLRRQRPALAADGRRQRHGRPRAGADRGLVPAVPEPLGRQPRLRRRRRALRQRRRRRELQLRRLRPGRQPAQPVRRPAGRRRRDARPPPTAEGGALRSQDLRTTGDPTGARRHDPPRRSRTRRRGCRTTRCAGSADRERAADRRLRPAQPVPDSPIRPGHERALGRRRRLERPGRRSTGSLGPRRRAVATSAGRATRAPRARPATTAPTSTSARASTRPDPAPCTGAVLRLPPRAPRSSPARPARRAARRSPGSRSTPAATPYPAAYDGALFFADYSRDCIWVMRDRRERPARPARPSDVRGRRGEPGRPPDRPGRRPLLRRLRRRHDPAASLLRRRTRPPIAVATADADERAAPARRSTSTAPGSSDPDAGDTLSYAWDLDGDGEYDDSTAAQPTRTYTPAATTRRACEVTDDGGASEHRVGHDHRRATRRRPQIDLRRPLRRCVGRGRTGSTSTGRRPTRGRRRCPPSALDWRLVLHHCPSNCHSTRSRDFPGVPAPGSFNAPDHEYPSHLELDAHRDRPRAG